MNYKLLSVEKLEKQLSSIGEIRERGWLSSEYKFWHESTISILEENFGVSSNYTQKFRQTKYKPSNTGGIEPNLIRRKEFNSRLEQAGELIRACIRAIQNNERPIDSQQDAIQFIKEVCRNFSRVARMLGTTYRKERKGIDIKDEYDVQHLFHALLLIKFDDIRPEDVNSNYAGATSRVDFLIKKERIVIEVKKTREGLRDKEIGEQLIIDISRYSQSQDCETLICFVYDPDQLIRNPIGLERDLSKKYEFLEVIVIISPKN
jgi:hypothetical protein